MLSECASFVSKEETNFLILLCKFQADNQVNELDAFLKLHLSEHFLPNLILPIQTTIPLSINGKIDRARLYPLYLAVSRTDPDNNLTNIWQVRRCVSLVCLDVLEFFRESYTSLHQTMQISFPTAATLCWH
jgi:hypothetical protein